MKPVTSLRELRDLSYADSRYEKVTIAASTSLGAREDVSLHDHLEWLRIYAFATSEQGVIDQINSLIPQNDQ
jgi:hypothetical protein